MENLEQFSVLADYHRKDSHQVNLSEGQVVHVIEKHDTGEPTLHSTLNLCCVSYHMCVDLGHRNVSRLKVCVCAPKLDHIHVSKSKSGHF